MGNIFAKWLSSRLWVMITGSLPVVELKGAIPLARQLGLDGVAAFVWAVAGNILPVPSLMLFLEPLRKYWENKSSLAQKIFSWLDKKTKHHGKKIKQYGPIGLAILTAIPLPYTGAWTASIVAIFFKIPFWPAFFSILAGLVVAGLLTTILVYGII